MSLKKKLRKQPVFDEVLRVGPALSSRREVRQRLRRLAPLMAEGTYRLRWNLAHRELAPDETPSAIRAAFLDHNRERHLAYRLADSVPPHTVTLTAGESAGDDEAAADVLLTRGECTLLFGRDGQRLMRLFDDPAPAQRILDHAAYLGQWLRIPQVEPLAAPTPGLYGVSETLMPGTIFKLGSPEANVAAYRDFLRQCAEHASQANGRYGRGDEIRQALDWPLPEWLASALNRRSDLLQWILEPAPMLFSHGDCHPGNLLVLPEGGAGLIDLERAEWMPFFFDPLYLLRSQHPSAIDLRRRYLAGELDDALAPIWEAVGDEFHPERRLSYLLAVSLAHGLRSQYREKALKKRARKLLNSTRALRSACAAEAEA